MTGIALQRSNLVTWTFATSERAIVTAGTGANGLGMIHRTGRQWFPRSRRGLVASLTVSRTRNMAACGFAVTIATNADDLGVIDGAGLYRRPLGWIFLVAGIANRGGVDMQSTTSTRRNPIMTANTIAGKIGVIRNNRGKPRRYHMANITFRSRDNVSRAFSTRQYTIVTTRAGANGLGMVNRSRG